MGALCLAPRLCLAPPAALPLSFPLHRGGLALGSAPAALLGHLFFILRKMNQQALAHIFFHKGDHQKVTDNRQ